MKRAPAVRTAAVFLPLALTLGPVAACSKQSALTEKGGSCYAATECAPGLVCVPKRDGSRICSDDLTGLGAAPPDGGARDAPQDGPATVVETGPPDAGTDTGAVQDAADDG